MKILQFIDYDISEGIVRFWKRYLLLIFLTACICIVFDKVFYSYVEILNMRWSPLEYGIEEFWGRYPYHYAPGSTEQFSLPFSWICHYLILAYCVGSYVRDDMEGFGIQMMIKSKQRKSWWCAKCIWCILVNIIYFGILWGTNVAYSWIMNGDIHFQIHIMRMRAAHESILHMKSTELYLAVFLLPILTGIIQSIFQIIGCICFGSVQTMIVLSGILVFSCYYSNRFLIHGYAMLVRFFSDTNNQEYSPLNVSFGLKYLSVFLLVLVTAGYFLVKNKNILENKGEEVL